MPRPDNYYDSRLNDQPQPGAVQPSAPVSSGTNNGQATPSTFTQSKLYDNLSENQKIRRGPRRCSSRLHEKLFS